jgi:hypothetical protein
MFTSRGRLLGGGSVREAHTPDIQESPEGCKYYSLWKIKQIEWNIFKLKSFPKLKTHWSIIWDFMHGLLSLPYLVFIKLLHSENFPHTFHQLNIAQMSKFWFPLAPQNSRNCFYFHYFKMCVVVTDCEIIEDLFYVLI